jgi:hypothetical protein
MLKSGYFSHPRPKQRAYAARFVFKARRITEAEWLSSMERAFGVGNVCIKQTPYGRVFIIGEIGPTTTTRDEYSRRLSALRGDIERFLASHPIHSRQESKGGERG